MVLTQRIKPFVFQPRTTQHLDTSQEKGETDSLLITEERSK